MENAASDSTTPHLEKCGLTYCFVGGTARFVWFLAPYGPAMTAGRRRRVLAILIGVIVGGLLLLYSLTVFVFGEAPEWTSARSVCTQPESIVYEQGFSYAVFVRKPSVSLSLSPATPNAVVSRTADGSYGVYIELNSPTGADAVTCRWEPDHVVIVEPNGIEHRVPASVFTGGR